MYITTYFTSWTDSVPLRRKTNLIYTVEVYSKLLEPDGIFVFFWEEFGLPFITWRSREKLSYLFLNAYK